MWQIHLRNPGIAGVTRVLFLISFMTGPLSSAWAVEQPPTTTPASGSVLVKDATPIPPATSQPVSAPPQNVANVASEPTSPLTTASTTPENTAAVNFLAADEGEVLPVLPPSTWSEENPATPQQVRDFANSLIRQEPVLTADIPIFGGQQVTLTGSDGVPVTAVKFGPIMTVINNPNGSLQYVQVDIRAAKGVLSPIIGQLRVYPDGRIVVTGSTTLSTSLVDVFSLDGIIRQPDGRVRPGFVRLETAGLTPPVSGGTVVAKTPPAGTGTNNIPTSPPAVQPAIVTAANSQPVSTSALTKDQAMDNAVVQLTAASVNKVDLIHEIRAQDRVINKLVLGVRQAYKAIRRELTPAERMNILIGVNSVRGVDVTLLGGLRGNLSTPQSKARKVNSVEELMRIRDAGQGLKERLQELTLDFRRIRNAPKPTVVKL